MRLYNPSPEPIAAKCHGINYPIEPGHSIKLSNETANWILDRWSFVGLVKLENLSEDKDKMLTEIVTKSLEGLDNYITHMNDVMEGYLELDSEIKQQNNFGTCLRSKGVKRAQQLTDVAIRMQKDLEAKYGISIRKVEAEQKSTNLMDSINVLVSEFEADTERQQKAKQEEHKMDSILADISNQVNLTGNLVREV